MITTLHNFSLSSLSRLSPDKLTSCLCVVVQFVCHALYGRQTDRHAAYPTTGTQNQTEAVTN